MEKAFVQKQKERLLTEDQKIRKQLLALKSSDPFSDPEHAVDNAATDTDAREEIGHLTIEAESEDLEKRLQLITAALKRIEKGAYGICIKTGKKIPKARLLLVPEADSVVA
ncbi:TraR/DksA family transcriptional regulator [Candidatus Woesebacteria bacterium]|nr:TraR/DksA family transcriptional regulator [Candidatus Woesebacteria bacterium]